MQTRPGIWGYRDRRLPELTSSQVTPHPPPARSAQLSSVQRSNHIESVLHSTARYSPAQPNEAESGGRKSDRGAGNVGLWQPYSTRREIGNSGDRSGECGHAGAAAHGSRSVGQLESDSQIANVGQYGMRGRSLATSESRLRKVGPRTSERRTVDVGQSDTRSRTVAIWDRKVGRWNARRWAVEVGTSDSGSWKVGQWKLESRRVEAGKSDSGSWNVGQ